MKLNHAKIGKCQVPIIPKKRRTTLSNQFCTVKIIIEKKLVFKSLSALYVRARAKVNFMASIFFCVFTEKRAVVFF